MDHPLTEYLRRPDLKNPAKSMTQDEFAKLVGCSQPVISKFLAGTLQSFTQDTAERVVEVTKGRVTLLDCLYSTPFHQKQKRRPSTS